MSTDSSQKSEPRLERPENETAFSIFPVVAAARKQWLLVFACVLSIFGATLVWTLGKPKTYLAEALLRLDPDPPRPLGQKVELLTQSGQYWNRREFYESEFRVMRSMRVATATVRALGLHADPAFLGLKGAATAGFKPADINDAAGLLISRLHTQPVKDSSLVILQYEDTDPARCQLVLNTVVRIYLSQNLEQSSSTTTAAVEWLSSQLEDLKSKLEKSEVALTEFRKNNNVLSISLEDRHNILSSELEQTVKERNRLDGRRSELAARYKDLAKVDASDPLEAGASELLGSSVLSTLRTRYAEQNEKLSELLATYDEKNPKIIAARSRLDETRKAIRKEVESIKKAALGDLRRVESELAEINKREDALQRQAHDLQAFEVPYNQLARTKANNEKLYGLVLERTRETDLTRMMNFNNIWVIDEASKPKAPYKPNVPLNLAVGLVLGFGFGLGVAVLRESSDRSLRTPNDVEAHLGQTCLGLLPQIESERPRNGRRVNSVPHLNDRDLVVAQHPDSGIAEAARVIRTNLTFMSPDRPYRTLIVTSAIPEEGKTTVSCSIATVLAQSGFRVLLVDADLRRPRLHRTFRVSNDVGVTMAVSGQTPFDECIHETQIPNLSVLPSGPLPPNPAEILQSDRFKRLLEQLGEKYDRIIIDTPPILPVTDAAIISRFVDGTIVVVRGHRTHKAAATRAVRSLRDVRAHLVGVVLNAVDLGRHEYREYHYYYRKGAYYTSKANEGGADDGRSGPPAMH